MGRLKQSSLGQQSGLPKTTPKKKSKPKADPPQPVNIKLPKSQTDWLRETAQLVRGNNDAPVPAGQRVFPQHLIGVAIELLQDTEIDWSTVKNIDDLRRHLKL